MATWLLPDGAPIDGWRRRHAMSYRPIGRPHRSITMRGALWPGFVAGAMPLAAAVSLVLV